MPEQNENVEMAERIARLAEKQGGTAYYVGGFVRDRLRGAESKDVDVEIHGLTPGQLEKLLDTLGERISVGESFGVYMLRGYTLDIAMPRREACRGRGHRDFEISVDPFIGAEKAAARRDFTINALMENVLTGEIIDPYGGRADLKNGVLRHVSDASFPEDPLRVLRAAQFAARFGCAVAEETVSLCSRMPLEGLAPERVMGELEKALLKAERPSVFFGTLRRMGQLSVWFPELERTIGVEQDPLFHPEGDVWTHTLQVVDAAARFRDRVKDPLGFLLAAVVHDFGKTVCTQTVNGRIHAYRHETEGLPLAESFLRRLTSDKARIAYALELTACHMRPNMLAHDGASVKATNRLFDSVRDPEALLYLADADRLGKNEPETDGAYRDFLRERLEIYAEYMRRPCVMGRDLVAAGVRPSARFSEYLDFAHRLQLAGVEKKSALCQTLAMARKNGDI